MYFVYAEVTTINMRLQSCPLRRVVFQPGFTSPAYLSVGRGDAELRSQEQGWVRGLRVSRAARPCGSREGSPSVAEDCSEVQGESKGAQKCQWIIYESAFDRI